jgi:hypothetical protein
VPGRLSRQTADVPSRGDAAPTPRELAAWLDVASPRTARGRFVRSPTSGSERQSFAYAGPRPVFAGVPADVEVEFWHGAPDRWRIDAPAGPVCRSDGVAAVAWSDRGVEVGPRLHLLGGPDVLLHPSAPHRSGRPGDRAPDDHTGTIVPAELLGRRCWRWETADGVVWVDEATGCALRQDSAQGRAELTAFEVDVDLDPALFVPPVDVVPEAGAVRSDERPAAPDAFPGEPPGRPEAPFRVVWWPFGVNSHVLAGDPAVPEVLLELRTTGADGDPRFWLGVAPSGHRPRTRQRASTRTWEGDGWSFALSWRGDVSADDLDRVVASVPRSWELGGPAS